MLEWKSGERGRVNRTDKWSEPKSYSSIHDQQREREEVANEISGKERLPEDRWKRVGGVRAIKGRRSDEIIQSNTFSSRESEISFGPTEGDGKMTIEVPQNEEISGGGKNVEEKKSVLISAKEKQADLA